MKKSSRSFDVLITGLGGMGAIYLSRVILTAAALEYGFVCRLESRGLSQRGGTSKALIRMGDQSVAASLTCKVDLVIALEMMEGARATSQLKAGGSLIMSDLLVRPSYLGATDDQGLSQQVGAVLAHQQESGLAIYKVPVQFLLNATLKDRHHNIVMLGAASKLMPLKIASLCSAVEQNVHPKDLAQTMAAFELGLDQTAAVAFVA